MNKILLGLFLATFCAMQAKITESSIKDNVNNLFNFSARSKEPVYPEEGIQFGYYIPDIYMRSIPEKNLKKWQEFLSEFKSYIGSKDPEVVPQAEKLESFALDMINGIKVIRGIKKSSKELNKQKRDFENMQIRWDQLIGRLEKKLNKISEDKNKLSSQESLSKTLRENLDEQEKALKSFKYFAEQLKEVGNKVLKDLNDFQLKATVMEGKKRNYNVFER